MTERTLAGKVALVTGASSGIGAATATALAKAGAAVTVVARRAERLSDLVRSIEAEGGTALALAGDMTVEAEATGAVEQVVARAGRLDILINSAGAMQLGGIETANLAEYRRMFDINLFATLYTCRAAVPHMLAQGGGDIVTISSLAGRKGGPTTSAYSASKFAVNAMTDLMRREVGDRNIRVTTLMPGPTTTEVGDAMTDPQASAAIKAHVSREGAVMPSDIGETIAFILSLPRRANVAEITIRPTNDTTP